MIYKSLKTLLFICTLLVSSIVMGDSIKDLESIPVLHEGRIKPLYAVAISSYIAIAEQKKLPEGYASPVLWFMDLSCNRGKALNAPIFHIQNPQTQSILGIKSKIASWNDLEKKLSKLHEDFLNSEKKDPDSLNTYEKDLSILFEKVFLFQSLRNTLALFDHGDWEKEVQIYQRSLELEKISDTPKEIQEDNKELLDWYGNRYFYLEQASIWHPLPPEREHQKWSSIGLALLDGQHKNTFHTLLPAYVSLVNAYETESKHLLNDSIRTIKDYFSQHQKEHLARATFETYFYKSDVFNIVKIAYGAIFLLGMLYWFLQRKWLWVAIFTLSIAAFILQTCGIASRVYLEGRPPVTNLYSSAIFISWMAALFGLILEKLKPSGMGFAVLGALGGITLIIASNLELGGDTMESLRAVLNSNFWLATHVIMITIGYSATLFAGFISNLFIIRSLINKSFSYEMQKAWAKIIYQTVFMSLFFSFTGTMLGGIWADQSWGRFWGWDPKENGALIIVLWNILILHAKWGKIIKDRGVVLLTSLGTITTLLSWFGVNMLGSGLHSYGFMDRAFMPLMLAIGIQLLLTCIGSFAVKKRISA